MTREEAQELENRMTVGARRVFNCASHAIMEKFADHSVDIEDIAEALEAMSAMARVVIAESKKKRMN